MIANILFTIVAGWGSLMAPSSSFDIMKDDTKRCPKHEETLMEYGLQPVRVFSYIAWRESRCRVKARNARWDRHGNMVYALNRDRSYDSGLLQINSTWRTVTSQVCGEWAVRHRMQGLLTLDCNLRVAKHLLDNGGLAHWRMEKYESKR
jgi:hypothetical protein